MEGVPGRWRTRWRDAAWPLTVAVALAALLDHDWDGFVFRTVVEQLLAGHSPYVVAAEHPAYAFIGINHEMPQWWAYPPLMLVGMASTYWPATLIDMAPWAERLLWKIPMIASLAALAWVAGDWARRFGSDEAEARRVEKRFLWNPYLLLVAAAWGMTDVAMMAFYLGGLLAYGNGRPGRAGLLVGLAFLVKPFPAFLFLPMVPYLVRRHGWLSLRKFGVAVAATVAAVSLPFFLASPLGFWQQVVGMHLARGVQGLTLWQLVPDSVAGEHVVKILSPALMIASLLAVGYLSSRLKGKGTSLMLTLLAAIAILAWNRVVNEQYFVLVVAPLLILDQAHVLDKVGHFFTRWTPALFAGVIAVLGFHFLTFIPPDIALPLFGRPVDEVAEALRTSAPLFWAILAAVIGVLASATLFALAWLAIRILRRQPGRDHVPVRHWVPAASMGLLLVSATLVPGLQSAAGPAPVFVPLTSEPRVAAFTYIWWQNPSHDPAIQYGNWDTVSQSPEMGYYTSTRAVAQEQAQAMASHGIDTAIVSFHLGEEDRYRAFQDEANAVGLRVAPLIELNQIYDKPQHHPIDEAGRILPAAMYRLDDATQDAIVGMISAVAPRIAEPAAMRIDGRPVLFFYDSYVSGVSFHDEDKRALTQTLLDTVPIETLRQVFGNDTLEPTVDAVLQYHPETYEAFHAEGRFALWREAHLDQHVLFWKEVRERVGLMLATPVVMINGDALNERADFQAGTAKALASLDAFDGSFIYSPSFTWGAQRHAPFADTFHLWEDRNAWLTAFAAGKDKLSAYGVGPAYDDTVQRANGFVIPAWPNGPAEPSFYEMSWASTRARPPTLPVIATWNEYFEGSSIEPSDLYGSTMLEMTGVQAALLATDPAPTGNALIVVNERASRTSLGTSEMDDSHFWGLDLVAASSRALPSMRLAAIDASSAGDLGAADVVLVEGGRSLFSVDSTVASGLAAARGTVPIVVFGPEAAPELASLVDASCAAKLATPPGGPGLVAGDTLTAGGNTLVLQRAGASYTVGAICADQVAFTTAKPWIASALADPWSSAHAAINAQCLDVALRALAPSVVAVTGPTSCVVA